MMVVVVMVVVVVVVVVVMGGGGGANAVDACLFCLLWPIGLYSVPPPAPHRQLSSTAKHSAARAFIMGCELWAKNLMSMRTFFWVVWAVRYE